MLGRPFEIVTASGNRVAPVGDLVMIAPVTLPETYAAVMKGTSSLYLGPEKGYWRPAYLKSHSRHAFIRIPYLLSFQVRRRLMWWINARDPFVRVISSEKPPLSS